MGEARPLQKLKEPTPVQLLHRELQAERRRRIAAEAQVRKFHALLLQERIKNVPTRGGRPC